MPEQGNQRALTHGGHAVVAPVEAECVVEAIRAVLPVQHAADAWVVAELADALIRLHRFRRFVDANDPWMARSRTALNKVRSAMYWEERYTGRVFRLLRDLGMTPAARAKLGVDLMRQVSLAEAMSEPNPAKRADLLRQAGVDMDAGDE